MTTDDKLEIIHKYGGTTTWKTSVGDYPGIALLSIKQDIIATSNTKRRAIEKLYVNLIINMLNAIRMIENDHR